VSRSEDLLSIIRARGSASVSVLSAEVGVSQATVRRDLRRLATVGGIVRTYGGAAVAAPTIGSTSNREAKQRIGRAVAAMIEEGETVVISSGTTALEVARNLVGRRQLTVITNALDVVQVLIDIPGIDLIVLGGSVRPHMHSTLGHVTEMAIRELRADKLIFGIAAIDPVHGLSSDHLPEILIDRALRDMSRTVIVVADSSKVGRVESALVFGLASVDVLVTDDGISQADVDAISRAGPTVVIA
jgi:DeoR family transcriptional regulator, aga operon transcriptional repressor